MFDLTIFFRPRAYAIASGGVSEHFPFRLGEKVKAYYPEACSMVIALNYPLARHQIQYIETGRAADLVDTYTCLEIADR